jgi:hypothetical protein
MCYINYSVYLLETPKYFTILFFGKWRTQEVCFAQKTPKNNCLNLFEKGMCKLFFLEIIRDFLPKYLRKTIGLYF